MQLEAHSRGDDIDFIRACRILPSRTATRLVPSEQQSMTTEYVLSSRRPGWVQAGGAFGMLRSALAPVPNVPLPPPEPPLSVQRRAQCAVPCAPLVDVTLGRVSAVLVFACLDMGTRTSRGPIPFTEPMIAETTPIPQLLARDASAPATQRGNR